MRELQGYSVIAAILACSLSLVSCSGENGRYTEAVAPIEIRLQRVSADTDAVAASCKGAVKAEDVARVEEIQDRLSKLGFDFTSLMAPPDFAGRHTGMAKGIASEATGLSALKGFCGRALQMAVPVVTDAGSAQPDRQALQKGMDGQWKYFEDNHAFFKAHLKIFSNAIQGGRK
jgi:hypothetical protein